MPLPILDNWDTTAHSLHRAAHLLGTLRLLRLEHVPNFLELALKVRPEGLSSDTLPGGSEVILDFRQAAMVVRSGSDDARILALTGQSPATLFEALLGALPTTELAALLSDTKTGSLVEQLFNVIQTRTYAAPPNRDDLTDPQPFEVDRQTSTAYAAVLDQVFTGAARFRARLSGMMTPIVVWPEHFDLSFLWFAAGKADEREPHMNFGFAPFSPGFEQPYLYAYAWPLPEGYGGPQLPPQARWHTEGWTGAVVAYDHIRSAGDAALFVEDTCLAIYQGLLPLVRTLAAR